MGKQMTSDNDKKTLLEFPCIFPLKVVGYNRDSLEITITDSLKNNNVDMNKIDISKRASKDNNYCAYTIKFTATDQPQLDAIYQALTACKDIVMVL